LERILRTQGLSALDEGLPNRIQAAADAVERTLIEYTEARSCVEALNLGADHDGQALESTEARLFALRAAGRKYDVAPEALPEILERYRADLALSNSDGEALEMAERVEADTLAQWEQVAASLSAARVDAAERLAASVMQELAALQLGRVKMRTAFTPIGSGESGRYGAERAEFELQTNPGAGFGPLRKIASGGELARMSLALKCALSGTGAQPTLIFDEADQGVGGAVAAAIGERLAALGQDKQVFAITHSPQVASAADRQWRVHKAEQPDGSIVSDVSQLDAHQRLEEIARMLSGSQVTQEARAAASRLLEAA
ncbi:MAG: DNA repair protein RecN, partial [Pseudomonadota bacterium]